MTAFGRLWRRAPLWRTSVIVTVGALGMAAFYPTPALKKAMPWLPGHLPGATPYNAGSGASQPDGQQGGQSGGAPGLGDQIGVPDPGIAQHGSITIAGRTLPLPAGDWHPILTARSGAHGELSQQVLARTDRGVVSGVIVVRATQQPVPADLAEQLETPCHDDRDYAAHISDKAGVSQECSYTSNAVLENQSVSTDPFITAAFSRMRTLGFPIPSLMINVGWYYAAAAGKGTAHIETVETLVAPIEHGSRQLLAPPQYWNKASVHKNPDAAQFIDALDRWMIGWSRVLRQGFDGTLDTGTLVPPLINDPSAPRPA
ncbi:hypothetical protein AD931_12210 [Gluconobacter oxydans]|uniref:Uncharacterized protein n=2 Tax=Gluconobacter oxydans TaxID=442 RepID=A0AB34XF41_GLUOY|nr:hypothetical protein [Gluconobacter oxydans]AHK71576.1 hypothetical protein GLS_c16990 [Gluconobacter oxydans DSM 3504]KXV07365.1 hypothetical protein AD931_12210 [Gluconobacter oxydans]